MTTYTLTTSNSLIFTSTGLDIPEYATFTADEWLQAGQTFRQFVSTIDAAVAFCYGDWLNLGEQVLGEDYTQGLEVILPLNSDDIQLQRAEKTILQYKRLARETPRWMRGLPGLSARHYLDAIRIQDPNQRYEHLAQASVNGWSVRRAALALPTNGDVPQLPATRDDINHGLMVENHHLQHELDIHRSIMEEASSNVNQARDILEHVVHYLPTPQAQEVQKALSYLQPVVVQSEFVELVGEAIDLYDQGRILEMVEVMDKLRDLRREIMWGNSARADNGKMIEDDPNS